MSQHDLKGKTALVTGAARRIGRAIALALGDAGANIVIHYRQAAGEASSLRSELAAAGINAWLAEADFEDVGAARQLIQQVIRLTGKLDILVNSASIFLPGTLEDMKFEDWLRHMEVNSWAPFSLSREFARHAGRGKIVNLLDTRIAGYDWSHAAYILSKRSFADFTEMMAVEFAPHFTVNGVAPGLILPPTGKGEDYLSELAKTIPLQRHGNAADITDAVLYLLESDFVTGQIIFVDGGRHLMEQNRGPDHNK